MRPEQPARDESCICQKFLANIAVVIKSGAAKVTKSMMPDVLKVVQDYVVKHSDDFDDDGVSSRGQAWAF